MSRQLKFWGYVGLNLAAITVADSGPVYIFLLEETVMLVENSPKSIKIAIIIVVVAIERMTTRQTQCQRHGYGHKGYEFSKDFHNQYRALM